MSVAGRLIDFVNDDELAMQNLRKLLASCRYDRHLAGKIAQRCGVSAGLIRLLRDHPERCTVRTYGLMCRVYGWSEYAPGRKLPSALRQGVIPFKEADSSAPAVCGVRDAEMEELRVIAKFRNESIYEVLGRAVSAYITANKAILDFMKARGGCE